MAEAGLVTAWERLVKRVALDELVTPHLKGHLDLAVPKGVLDDTLYLEVPNETSKVMLQQRLRDQILGALDELAEFGGPTSFIAITNENLQVPVRTEVAYEPAAPEYDRDPATGPVAASG